MSPALYEGRCSCKCRCLYHPGQHCFGLCEECFLQWSTGSTHHAPAADNSYLGTYGINNIWTGWIIGQAPELVAERPEALLRPEAPRRCPACNQLMARRPGGWKCYNPSHELLAISEQPKLPRSPNLKALGACLP
jgi:hypothetical protein